MGGGRLAKCSEGGSGDVGKGEMYCAALLARHSQTTSSSMLMSAAAPLHEAVMVSGVEASTPENVSRTLRTRDINKFAY